MEGEGGGREGGGLAGRCKAGRASGDKDSHWCQAGAGYLFGWGSWEYWEHLLADEELMLSDTLLCRRWCVFRVKGYLFRQQMLRTHLG